MDIKLASYIPGPPPKDAKALPGYLEIELRKIGAAIALLADGHLAVSNAAPAKPRQGDIRYADGTNWNPGSGAGLYYYNGSVWTFIA